MHNSLPVLQDNPVLTGVGFNFDVKIHESASFELSKKSTSCLLIMQDPTFVQQHITLAKQGMEKAGEHFGALSPDSLNWKPQQDTWSIGQCLEHLIISNSTYFPIFEKITKGQFKMSVWERLSPFSVLFGNLLANQMQETVKIKMKTPPIFEPASSGIDGHVCDRFLANTDTLISYLSSFITLDLDKTVITSPAISFMTYPMRQVIRILVPHLHRHVNQAIRLRSVSGFPA